MTNDSHPTTTSRLRMEVLQLDLIATSWLLGYRVTGCWGLAHGSAAGRLGTAPSPIQTWTWRYGRPTRSLTWPWPNCAPILKTAICHGAWMYRSPATCPRRCARWSKCMEQRCKSLRPRPPKTRPAGFVDSGATDPHRCRQTCSPKNPENPGCGRACTCGWARRHKVSALRRTNQATP